MCKKRDKTEKKPKKMLTFALLYDIIITYLEKALMERTFCKGNSPRELTVGVSQRISQKGL